jgi:hypothetical protein
VFNQLGDLERCTLRPGNVHSADRWRGPNLEIYEFLEAEGMGYVIRLPANRVLQDKIGYLRKCPVGRPPAEVRRNYASFSYQARTEMQAPKSTPSAPGSAAGPAAPPGCGDRDAASARRYISSARLFYERAADAGDGHAALGWETHSTRLLPISLTYACAATRLWLYPGIAGLANLVRAKQKSC